ncbi:SF1B family DNA helicase RecD2 [Massiliimalia timonensis]|uniref:SF1B family DNA helicase RecD2 n=1 Tax=Massiliimalia timonensis TaxID=1987501 RepID=UPI00189DB9DD|nr:ATP-dependent RecD-like DNA helicase [Massiliimalia timonensis]
MAEKEWLNLCGSVDHIIYANRDSGFAVIELEAGDELICAVGNMPDVQEGAELSLMGYYTTHPNYGYQFRVETCEQRMPATAGAICKYLSSGVIKGIGSAIARRIVEKFGDDTLHIMEQSPQRLAEIKGITVKRSQELAEELKQVFGVRNLMLFLSQYGISPAVSVKVWKRWGVLAQDLIRENPYILCGRMFQLEFQLADQIARQQGISPDSEIRVSAGLSCILIHNLNNGHTCLPSRKLIQAAEKLLELSGDVIEEKLEEVLEKGELVRLKKKQEYLALPELYSSEQYIASRIAMMVSIPPQDEPQIDFVIRQIEEERNIRYEGLQKQAIKEALMNEIFILTGGPGTGKTTTLNGIIDVLEYCGKTLSIAAPTGRAAKRISEVTGREAKTIHRLLEVEMGDGTPRFAKNEQEPLISDAVVIDEMSMVDVPLFEALLRAMKPSAKLILVGDYHQLPSVGAGNVLHDLLASGVIPTIRLQQIFRQAAKSLIVTNAHRIVQGEMPDLNKKQGDFFFLSRRDNASASQTILDLACRRLPNSYGYSPTEDIQVLCPQRKGELGVEELNSKLQTQLNPPGAGKTEFKAGMYTYRLGDKVMQTKNNYDIEWQKNDERGMGIFNGDIGTICMIDKGSQTLAIDFEGRIAYYPFEMASDQLELAYAITVHKSQGNEFEAVVIPILGGYDRLYYRNLLYTAITRAKQIVILVGKEERIAYMVDNNLKSVRFTNLKHLLNGMVEEF